MSENSYNPVLKNKDAIFIDEKVSFGKNVVIYENVRIEGACFIGDNTVIMPNTYILESNIGNNCVIKCSYIENSTIKNDVSVGPYAHLRPNSIIENGAKIGNFVEIKNATIGENSKVSHLAYVGDAVLGKECNVGCGAIFVNYNGKEKNKTFVGDNVFIGSNCNVIAPVKINNNSYIVAGTTITDTVNEDDFVIGRVRQENKPNRANKYLKKYIKD